MSDLRKLTYNVLENNCTLTLLATDCTSISIKLHDVIGSYSIVYYCCNCCKTNFKPWKPCEQSLASDIRCVIHPPINIEYLTVQTFGTKPFEKNWRLTLSGRIGSGLFRNSFSSNGRVTWCSFIRCWIYGGHHKMSEDLIAYKTNHRTFSASHIHINCPGTYLIHQKWYSLPKF